MFNTLKGCHLEGYRRKYQSYFRFNKLYEMSKKGDGWNGTSNDICVITFV